MKNLVHPFAGFDAPLGVDLGFGKNPAGLICAANEDRLDRGHFREDLTGYTVGWKDPENLDALIERLFGLIPVARKFGFKKAVNAQAFLSESDDNRASGAAFKRVEYDQETTDSRTLNRGLTVRLDHDDYDDVDAQIPLTVDRLRQRLSRNSLRRGMALLDANDTTDAMEFAADTNPDGLVRAKLNASRDITGLRPDTVVYGDAAWEARLDAYEDPTRENGLNRADKTPAQLAAYLRVRTVEVVSAVYQSTATAKEVIVPARVYAYPLMPGAGKDDPSAVKRFTSNARGGGRWGVYVKQADKWTDVTVEHYERYLLTGLGIVSGDVTTGGE
jgi:hypothetical protein